jgi:16S rRNA (uracil1498-N3)-methyltransferase
MKGEIRVGEEVLLKRDSFFNGLTAFSGPGLHPGRIVTLTDFRNQSFRARIISFDGEDARAFVFEHMGRAESGLELILLQALPSRERMELVIEKCTELGVDVIVPFHSERSITLAERDEDQAKSHRWQKRAVRAMEQCRRAKVPLIAPYCELADALMWTEWSELKLMLWEKERGTGMRELLKQACKPRSVSLLVGPEGGLSQDELRFLAEKGFQPVSLGSRILRTETAAILGAGLIQYELGDLGVV